MSATDEFLAALQELCRTHNASIFPRKDSKQIMVSVMVGDIWTDYLRISAEEVRAYIP